MKWECKPLTERQIRARVFVAMLTEFDKFFFALVAVLGGYDGDDYESELK